MGVVLRASALGLCLAAGSVRAQTVARADVDNEDQFSLAILGGGGVTADMQNPDAATKVQGQVGVDIHFANRMSLAFTFNATNEVGTVVRSNKAGVFAAQIANQDLGPYSVGIDVKANRVLADLVGFYLYGRGNKARWTVGSADPTQTSTDSEAYDAFLYSVGIGSNIAVRPSPDSIAGNKMLLEIGGGVAVRGIGGDITLKDRLSQFIGTERDVFVAPELRLLFNWNAIRATVALQHFSRPKDVDGLSSTRFVVSVGAAGDAIVVKPRAPASAVRE